MSSQGQYRRLPYPWSKHWVQRPFPRPFGYPGLGPGTLVTTVGNGITDIGGSVLAGVAIPPVLRPYLEPNAVQSMLHALDVLSELKGPCPPEILTQFTSNVHRGGFDQNALTSRDSSAFTTPSPLETTANRGRTLNRC